MSVMFLWTKNELRKPELKDELIEDIRKSDSFIVLCSTTSAVKTEAKRRGFQKNNGIYRFPLGTVIPYECEEKNGQNEPAIV